MHSGKSTKHGNITGNANTRPAGKRKPARKNLKSAAALALASLAGVSLAQAQSTTPAPSTVDSILMETMIQKGMLTQAEADRILAEAAARQTNGAAAMPSDSKWKISDAIKGIQLYGDVRFRYEYRGVDNVPGASPDTFYRERARYAIRIGIRGDLVDQFSYGLRLESANNPRSPWDTFGNNTTAGNATPSDKNGSGVYIGQAWIGWHPDDYYEMSVGRMPMPLYTTPMVWDSDINPEGAFEKVKFSHGDVDWFADAGQFDYQDPGNAGELPSGDTFLLAWQAGANVKLDHGMSFKVAPVLYSYTDTGTTNAGLSMPYTGQGGVGSKLGQNVNFAGGAAFNQNSINDLLVLEVPAEFNFNLPQTPFGPLHGRVFGDFGYNLEGAERARAAYDAGAGAGAFPGVSAPETSQVKAWQAGIGFGTANIAYGPTQGLVYGSACQKHTWEARMYWQHVEQYALDVNLMDSDFFEGRGNLEGIYTAFAYGVTDDILTTIRFGYANPIQSNLGNGGNNLDIPGINPIKNYTLVQMDLSWKF